MNTEPKQDPRVRMRNMLNGQSAINRLPKRKLDTQSYISAQAQDGADVTPVRKDLTHPADIESVPGKEKRKYNFGPPFWTIASIFSLTINLAMAVVLFLAWTNLPSLNVNGVKNSVTDMGTGLLGGLYTNFEKMDRAHITRTIPVQTTIPVKFDLALNQQTNVVLSQDVTINNALVTVQTGGLNITRALATIVLPQGTNLPIVLNLTVPVDTTVPVSLNVDVDIPLNETQLHDPFVGLRNVVEPYYCMINPGAINLDAQSICK